MHFLNANSLIYSSFNLILVVLLLLDNIIFANSLA